MRDIEIVPLVDLEDYQWTSPEDAEVFGIYERDHEGFASHLIDVPGLDVARAYVENVLGLQRYRVFDGERWVTSEVVTIRLEAEHRGYEPEGVLGDWRFGVENWTLDNWSRVDHEWNHAPIKALTVL